MSDVHPDTGALSVRFKVRFELERIDDAEAWEGVFPGLGAVYTRAVEKDSEEKWKLSFGGPLELRIGMAKDRKAGGDYASGAAEVAGIVATLSQAIQVVDVALVFGGVKPDEVEGFTSLMTKAFLFKSSTAQLDLYEAAA